MTITSVGEWRNKGWKNEESTSAIVKRDTGVEVHGNDKTSSAVRKDLDTFIANGGSAADAFDYAIAAGTQMQCDQAHVALTEVLDLPAGCKQREEATRPGVSHAPGSGAAKMADKLQKDPAGLAVLQAHCDRGVIDAYTLVPTPMPEGMTMEKFLTTHPKQKEICDSDPAYKVGFEAFFEGSAAERKELIDNMQKHDVRAGNGAFVRA